VVRKVPPIVLILLAGGLVRLALWLWYAGQSIHIWDERDYNALAISLAERGEFAFRPGSPTAFRPPLYPVIVAGLYRLAGVESFQTVRLLQAGLSLLNVLLLYRLGARVFDRRVGLWAAGLYCFYPSLLGFNILLLTEVLFTFLLCATCYVLVLALQRASFAWLALGGVLLGLAALTRSVLWLFPAVLSVLLLRWWPQDRARRAIAAGLLVATFALTIAPWVIRNTRLEQTFVAIDTMGGRNFMMGNYRFTPLYRAWDAVSLTGEEFWYHELESTYSRTELSTQGQIDRLAFRQGLAFVQANPALTLQRDIVKFFHFWGLERELIAGAAAGLAGGYFGPLPMQFIVVLTVVIFGSYVTAMVSGVFGMVMAPPPDRRIHGLFLAVIAFICAVHTVTFGHSRYHLPIMPLVLLYAASAWVHAGEIWRRRRERSFLLAAGLSGMFVLWWLWEIFVVDGERYWRLLRAG
jgi:4-amino-4-deoxy-L-arabinose transferase-like glycosyltransferase